MKQRFLLLRRGGSLLMFIGALTALLVFAFISCQKQDGSAGLQKSESFDAQAAKEWYYGFFKKTAEWKLYASKGRGLKLPLWTEGIYKRFGQTEIVEFPLVRSKSVVPISMQSISASDAKRVADCSLSRILFFKSQGKIVVRELRYIPDLSYAKQNGFDISRNSFGFLDDGFKGRLIFSNWEDDYLVSYLVENGKLIRKESFKPIGSTTASITAVSPCDPVLMEEMERDCVEHYVNDRLISTECGEWQPTGNAVVIDDCNGGGFCSDMAAAECLCSMTGICSGDGGGASSGDDAPCTAQMDDEINSFQLATEPPTVDTKFSFHSDRRVRNYHTVILRSAVIKCVSHDRSVQEKGDDEKWRFSSMEHVGESIIGSGVGLEFQFAMKNTTFMIGEFSAIMNSQPEITASIICKSNTFSKSKDFSFQRIFSVDEGN